MKDDEDDEANLISEAQEEQEDAADYVPGTFDISALPLESQSRRLPSGGSWRPVPGEVPHPPQARLGTLLHSMAGLGYQVHNHGVKFVHLKIRIQ